MKNDRQRHKMKLFFNETIDGQTIKVERGGDGERERGERIRERVLGG